MSIELPSMLPEVSGVVMASKVFPAVAPLLLFLSFLGAILIWSRRTRRRSKPHILIQIAGSSRLGTRPAPLDSESEAVARRVGEIVDRAGLGPVKVLLFQGEPTTDLIVEVAEPRAIVTRLQALLEGLPVTISDVAHPGDLRWHTKLWRHL